MLRSVLASRFEGDHVGATALQHRDRSISYAELARASRAVADKLARGGVQKGANVGILTEDRTLVVPAMIGIMAHGCIFAPLDPSHPPAHLSKLAETADL